MADTNTFPPRSGLAPALVVAPVCGMGVSTMWRRVREGTFPKPIHIGPRSTRWRWEDIHRWLEAQGAESRSAAVIAKGSKKRKRAQ